METVEGDLLIKMTTIDRFHQLYMYVFSPIQYKQTTF